ncbi:MAG: serine hydrolase domain-containing protein [Aristaeellaceae bacterium]
MTMISSASILSMVERLEREQVCLHGFELRVGGSVRAEGYYAPFRKGDMHRMYSVSKTMTGLAIALLMDDGKLRLDDRIASFFPDKLPQHPDPRILRLTIHDMLRMATCHRKTTYREGVDENWDGTFFTVKPTHEPGTMFNYDTSCSQVLAALAERLSGKGLLAFLEERIFRPIGADDPKRWLTDPSGVPTGGTGLMMSLRDMAKVAQLMMDGGRGLVSAEYIRAATSKQSCNDAPNFPEEGYGYGYQLWMTRYGWAMYGMGGQMALCCPEKRVLLCTIADTRLDPYGIQRLHDAFQEDILDRVNELEIPGSDEALQRKLANLRMVSVPHVGGACPQGSRTYIMEDNEQHLKRLVLEENAIRVVWEDSEDVFQWDVLGQNKMGIWPNTDVPALTSAGLMENGALHVRCQAVGDSPCGAELFIYEKDGTVSVRMRMSSDPLTTRYQGIYWGRTV